MKMRELNSKFKNACSNLDLDPEDVLALIQEEYSVDNDDGDQDFSDLCEAEDLNFDDVEAIQVWIVGEGYAD